MFFNYKSDFLKFILGWQDKISGSNQQMRPQPCVTGVNCQEKSMLKEKLEQIWICEIDINHSNSYGFVQHWWTYNDTKIR